MLPIVIMAAADMGIATMKVVHVYVTADGMEGHLIAHTVSSFTDYNWL